MHDPLFRDPSKEECRGPEKGTLERSLSVQRDTCLGPSESMKVEQHHSSGRTGSGESERRQRDWSQFFFHTEKKRGDDLRRFKYQHSDRLEMYPVWFKYKYWWF